MSIFNWKLAASALAGWLIILLSVTAWSFHASYQQAKQLIDLQKDGLAQQQELITILYADDARNRTLMAEQQQREQLLRQQGEIYQREYRNAIKNDTCARTAAPDAVLGILRGTTSISNQDSPAAP